MFSSVATRRPAGDRSSAPLADALSAFGASALAAAGLSSFFGCSLARRSGCAFLDDGDDLLAVYRVAHLVPDFLEHAIDRRGHFKHHLVGFEIDQVLVALDRFTGLLVPGGDGGVGDGLGQNGDFEFDGHRRALE